MQLRANLYLDEDKFNCREQQDSSKDATQHQGIELTRAQKRSDDPACDGRGDPEPHVWREHPNLLIISEQAGSGINENE